MKVHADFLGCSLFRELAESFPHEFFDFGIPPLGELERAAAEHPDDPGIRTSLGLRYLQDARLDSAFAQLACAVQLDPDVAAPQILLACRLDLEQAYQTAVELIHGCLRRHANYGPALVALGYCYEKLGETSDAIAAYERALKAQPYLRRVRARFAGLLHASLPHKPQNHESSSVMGEEALAQA